MQNLLQHRKIDYKLLATACGLYNQHGYEQVEVPWMVDGDAQRATFVGNPADDISFRLTNDKFLVCSAEQGFVEMATKGQLKAGKKYYSVSPCFRDEYQDATHSKWFMKLELFTYGTPSECTKRVDQFMADAKKLIAREFSVWDTRTHIPESLYFVQTAIGQDLMYRYESSEVELGSYGVRQLSNGLTIAYGTGLALPRASLIPSFRNEAKLWRATT
jgi:hypothetical protein